MLESESLGGCGLNDMYFLLETSVISFAYHFLTFIMSDGNEHLMLPEKLVEKLHI